MMTSSTFTTQQYTSSHFVESAGAILFSGRQICLIHYKVKDEWYLPKGRRNIDETRQAAALREVKEETGHSCSLLPVDMETRAPPAIEVQQSGDEVRKHKLVCEPFMVTLRHLDEQNLKLIWWYLASMDEEFARGEGESQFSTELFDFDEARNRLTFVEDREVVDRAIKIFTDTYGGC